MSDSPEKINQSCNTCMPLCADACDNAPIGIVVVGADKKVQYVNAAAADFLGGADFVQAVLAVDFERGDAAIVKFCRQLKSTLKDGARREFEVELAPPKGRSGSYNIQISQLKPDQCQSSGVAVWIRDVSGYRQMSDRLIAAEKMASLGTMASGVARHFNTIIGGLTSAVDKALTTDDPAGTRRALKMTSEAIAGISSLTQSLMSFSQDERRSDLADLTEVLLTFVQLVERPLGDSGIAIDLQLQRVPITAIETNRMHQVLGNLLSNSEDAMADGGTITITTGCDDHWVWMDFSDTGPGIAESHRQLVFEPFFTTKGLVGEPHEARLGLGLSVAHGLVLEMGGEIALNPSETGASFRLRFPRK